MLAVAVVLVVVMWHDMMMKTEEVEEKGLEIQETSEAPLPLLHSLQPLCLLPPLFGMPSQGQHWKGMRAVPPVRGRQRKQWSTEC